MFTNLTKNAKLLFVSLSEIDFILGFIKNFDFDNINKKNVLFLCFDFADVAKLVDALDLGSSVERRGGSSPFIRTDKTA